MSKYRELAPGLAQCVLCGETFDGPFLIHDKRRHSQSHKDGSYEAQKSAQIEAKSLPGIAQTIEHMARPGYGEVVRKGDGYTRPDKYGRWRVGKTPLQKRMITYFKVAHRLDMSELSRDKFIEHLLNDGCFPRWAGKTSPLQQLSYAFSQHLGWEQIKQAAYNLAYDEAIRIKVTEMFEEFFGENEGDI